MASFFWSPVFSTLVREVSCGRAPNAIQALAPATQQNEAKRQQTPVAKPKPLAEPPAEAEERPGRAKNLFSYVFGSEAEGEIGQEPATEESVAIEMEPTTMREQEELEAEC